MPARTHFICTVPGCGRVHKTGGLCSMHAQRMWKHGDVAADLPPMFKDLPIPGHSIVVEGVECWAVPMGGTMAAGREFIVDLCDRPLVDPYRWHISTHGYATRHDGPSKIQIHQILLQVEDGFEVDHENRNRLDNRRCNLRPSTHQKNTFNSNLRKHKTSRFRGVHWDSSRQRWTAVIQRNGTAFHIGRFVSEEQAALKWNEMALERGEFAVFNTV